MNEVNSIRMKFLTYVVRQLKGYKVNCDSVILVGLPYHEFQYKTKRLWSSIEVGIDENEEHKFKRFIEKYDLYFINSDSDDHKRRFIGYKVHSVYGDAQVVELTAINAEAQRHRGNFYRNFDLTPNVYLGVSYDLEENDEF